MAIQTEKTINIIRGKNLVDKTTQADVNKLLDHIDALEAFLEDGVDTFGTESWRRAIGADE